MDCSGRDREVFRVARQRRLVLKVRGRQIARLTGQANRPGWSLAVSTFWSWCRCPVALSPAILGGQLGQHIRRKA